MSHHARQLVPLIAALWWLVGGIASTVVANVGDASPPVTNAMCPVFTDEPVDPEIHIDYAGATVYFCCERCRTRFEQDPQRYLAALPQGMLAQSAADPSSGHEHDDHQSDESGHDHATDHDGARGYQRTITWIGKFHPLVVHFPIALLIAGFVAEVLGRIFNMSWLKDAARYSILVGAGGAVVAAGLGWANAAFTEYNGQTATTLFWHRWLGVSTAVTSVIAAAVSEYMRRRTSVNQRRLYFVLLAIAVVLVGVTGHFGGTLVFGPDFLSW